MAGVDMKEDAMLQRAAWNGCRYVSGTPLGHYESWFQRANHPQRALAFWIRYTIFSPALRPQDAVGELWAIFFDGERGRVTAVKEAAALSGCRFASSGIDVHVGAAVLTDTHLEGRASTGGHTLEWSLGYEGAEPPLLLLPRPLYERSFPRAKAVVGTPNAAFRGVIRVDGEAVAIENWKGSQNHNWGSRHTDSYAWGQVAGFDDAPDVFLECSTAQLRLGPVWTPRMSLVVLRAEGEEFALNSLAQALRARGRCGFFDWRIESASSRARVTIRIHAPRSIFVGLVYANPPGGAKTCLNTKLAACELTLERPGREARTWTTAHRAAFEILTDRSDHGVAVAV
jgi:hypothetical protein